MRIWILAIATVAVLIGVAGGSYWYGGNGADESTLVLNRAPAASDGIKLHGDWTVTVSNPDGSVDSVHEFKNDLNTKGASFLTALLGGPPVGHEGSAHRIDRWDIIYSFETDGEPYGKDNFFTCKENLDHYAQFGFSLSPTVSREASPGNPLLISENCTLWWVKSGMYQGSTLGSLKYDIPQSPGTMTGKLTKVKTQIDGYWHNFYPQVTFKYFPTLGTQNLDAKVSNIDFTEHKLSGNDQIDVTAGQLLNIQVRISFE